MCGIFAVHQYGPGEDIKGFRARALMLSKRLRHRGPDWSGCYQTCDSIFCHERLAIVGVDTGAQPLVNDDGSLVLAVNGEIYNHRTLRKNLKNPAAFKTHSDCEVIMHLYKEHGTGLCSMLDGMFSFVLLDTSVTPSRMIAARDPVGITTLYQGRSSSRPGAVYFASELKALHDECDDIISFPPGHVYDSATGKTERYFQPTWWEESKIPSNKADLKLIRETLEHAVKKRLMSEVPYGVLLSGGLDSSLIAAIAARETDKVALAQSRSLSRGRASRSGSVTKGDGLVGLSSDEQEQEEETLTAWPRLHSFSIGLENSPDLLAARVAAEYLGTVHHEYTFTVQEGLDAVPDVIYHLETYDVTTVRASTPMYLLSRKIKAMGVKMVLSGEGSDEIFGGYLYFHAAPSPSDFHQECIKRVKNLHTADCLRANKSTMAWGLEARVPFLDKEFLELSLNTRPEDKTFGKGAQEQKDAEGRPIMEKYILRKAFDISPDDGRPYLPDEILWRQKEQFSDGVGYSWIDGLKEHSASSVSDAEFANAATRYPSDTPDTKEAYYIRQIFEGHFPSEAAAQTAVRWIPRADWGCAADPSGRAVAIHDSAYEKKE
ncbi:asparagine synthase (glutamine-hydrolyzing), partial [Phenoliferia sp. Uapishka_3]